MKMLSLLVFLQVNICFSQPYDSLTLFNAVGEVKALELDEENGRVYLSNGLSVNVYNIAEGKLSSLEISEKNLPGYALPAKKKAQDSIPSLDPLVLRKALFTENGDYLIFYYLKHEYAYINVYKLYKKRYKLYTKFNNDASVYSLAVSQNLTLVAGSAYGQLRLWDIKRKKFIRLMQPKISKGVVSSIKFSEDHETKIIISYGSSQCIIIDSETDQVEATWHYGFIDVPGAKSRVGQGAAEMTFVNSDSLAIVSLTNRMHTSLNLWTVKRKTIYQESIDRIQPIASDRLDSVLFIADSAGTISEYSINQRKLTRSFPSGQAGLKRLKLSKSGKYMITTTQQGEIKIWLKKEAE